MDGVSEWVSEWVSEKPSPREAIASKNSTKRSMVEIHLSTQTDQQFSSYGI